MRIILVGFVLFLFGCQQQEKETFPVVGKCTLKRVLVEEEARFENSVEGWIAKTLVCVELTDGVKTCREVKISLHAVTAKIQDEVTKKVVKELVKQFNEQIKNKENR